MKEYAELLADDPEFAARSEIFVKKVKDISEFLIENNWVKPGKTNGLRVTYHEPCHLVHAQKISEQPREIIKSIPGIEYCELPEATWCCGSAGIYNVVRYDDSMKVLERKMENIRKTKASWVVTGNPGCMIQLIYGAKKFNVDIEVIHPVSLLWIAYNSGRK